MAQSLLLLIFTRFCFTYLAFFFFFFFFFFFSHLAPKVEASPPPLNALVTPIYKDSQTSLYSLSFYRKFSYLLDLDGPFPWSPCPPSHPTFPCNSPICLSAHAHSSSPPHCPSAVIGLAPNSSCNCTVSSDNPAVSGKFISGDLTLSTVSGLFSTNGSNPTGVISVNDLVSSCTPEGLLASLPAGTLGEAGFGRSSLSFPSQVFSKFFFKTQFAVCLPSEASYPGVAFFGSGPFNLMPPTMFDAAANLQYTRLLEAPKKPGYYLDVKAIAFNCKAVAIPEKQLKLASCGDGGVRISTAAPYTVLRRDIYEPFLKAFKSATKALPRMPTVKPFDLCFNSSALGFNRVGYIVPEIDLVLSDGKNWTIFGSNSVKQVSQPETVCLAFVDGGPKAEAAVMLGGFQMENNFLLFDVGRSRLGFSSTLFFIRASCANFNFTLAV